eukprot:636580-Lingulodinium_polyedra.AAC.1
MQKRLKHSRQHAGLLRQAAVGQGWKHINHVEKVQAHVELKENAAQEEADDRFDNDEVDVLAKEA